LGDVQQVDDAARVAVLQYDPEVIVLKVRAIVFDDVLVVAEPQNLYLLFDGIDLGETGGG
jgi:hypothetical protein